MKKTKRLLIGAMLATVVLMLSYTASFDGAFFLFLLLGISPYGFIYFLLGRLREGMPARFVAVVLWILLGVALAFYVQALWIAPDPQSGLAFITVPVYQWALLFLALAILLFLRKKQA